MKIRKILCPVDFSKYSQQSLEYAAFIALSNHATLFILHVIEHMHHLEQYRGLNLIPNDMEDKIGQDAKDKLTLLACQYQDSIGVETVIRIGKPFVEIVKAARELEIDQVIMGSHGRTGLSHLLIGSVAEKVTRKAPCPVLIFREKGSRFEMP